MKFLPAGVSNKSVYTGNQKSQVSHDEFALWFGHLLCHVATSRHYHHELTYIKYIHAQRLRGAAGNEVVVAGSGVGDETVEGSLRVEDNTVGTGGATRVDFERVENGPLVPRALGGEAEALVVLVLMRVLVRAYGMTA
jgi:hypothetical protein